MKKIILLSLIVLMLPIVAAANDNGSIKLMDDGRGGDAVSLSSQDNSTTLSIAGFEIGISPKDQFGPSKKDRRTYRYHYKGKMGTTEIGLNNLTKPDYSAYPADEQDFLNLWNARSFYLGLNLFKASGALSRSHWLGYSTAIGLTFRTYAFDQDITLRKIDGMIHPVQIDHNVKITRFTTMSLTVPFTLEANLGGGLFIAGGVYGELALRGKSKYKFPKNKTINSHYIEMFQYGVTARVGVKGIYAFGNFALSEIFQQNKGPATSVYTVGIGFGI